jgi:hypothetical protein
MSTSERPSAAPSPDLAAVMDQIWQGLRAGVADRAHPWHTAVLATVGTHGAEARTVVLRAAERGHEELRFHTDRRSAKLRELAANPGVCLVCYGDGVQLRARGSAIVHRDDDLADEAWARSNSMARRCYLPTRAPGTPLDASASALPAAFVSARPTLEETVPGRANFAVVSVIVDAFDWLDLTCDGHRRAQFQRRDAHWSGRWVVP